MTTSIDDVAWSKFAGSHPDASAFHLPAWATTIAECYRFRAFALTVRDTSGSVVAGAPVIAARSLRGRLRWISLPFTDYCPILVREGLALETISRLVAEYVLSGTAAEYELRAHLPAADNTHPVTAGFRHVLELPADASGLRSNRGHRGNVGRAVKGGVKIRRGTEKGDLAAFYHLHVLTRRRHGVPVQPQRFFELLWANVLSVGNGFIVTATLEGRPVAAAIYLAHNRVLTKKYLASDPAYQDSRAGHLIDWEVMTSAYGEGFRTLDLGRSDVDADGLRRYKSSWGSAEEPLAYSRVSVRPPTTSHLRVGALPARIIRSSPPWVCQRLGELLYRYSA